MTLVRLAKFEDIDALTKMRLDFSREYNDSIIEGDYSEFEARCTEVMEWFDHKP